MHRSPALQRPVVLGSTSRYRRELLQRLNLCFQVAAPAVDETPQPGEAPRALALRLALAKARAVAQQHPEALLIGADQVADLAGAPLGKPGQHQRAVQQLRQMRGQAVAFQTAVAVVCAATGFEQLDLACVQVQFRALSDAEIERYLRAEQPWDGAGAPRREGRGTALLDAIHSDDPTALMGLPLIRTCRMLRAAGLTLPEVRPTPPRTQARVACIWCPLRWTLAATARSRCRTSCRPAPCRRRPRSGTGGARPPGAPAPTSSGSMRCTAWPRRCNSSRSRNCRVRCRKRATTMRRARPGSTPRRCSPPRWRGRTWAWSVKPACPPSPTPAHRWCAPRTSLASACCPWSARSRCCWRWRPAD